MKSHEQKFEIEASKDQSGSDEEKKMEILGRKESQKAYICTQQLKCFILDFQHSDGLASLSALYIHPHFVLPLSPSAKRITRAGK